MTLPVEEVSTIWESISLYTRWHEITLDSFFRYLSALARARNPGAFKGISEHARDSGISGKYVHRPIDSPTTLFHSLKLLVKESSSDGSEFRLLFELPLRQAPPSGFNLVSAFTVSWLNDERNTPICTDSERAYYLDVDHGLCCYCGGAIGAARPAVAHLCPVSKRGADVLENKAMSHSRCNSTAFNKVPGYAEGLEITRFRGEKVRTPEFVISADGFVPVWRGSHSS